MVNDRLNTNPIYKAMADVLSDNRDGEHYEVDRRVMVYLERGVFEKRSRGA